jgi:hypothetical protein
METMADTVINVAELHAFGASDPYESAAWIKLHYDLVVQSVILRARRGLTSMNFPIHIYKTYEAAPAKGTMCESDFAVLKKMCRAKFPDATVDFNYVDPDFFDINICW